jgi:hypothetical protein
MAREVEAQRRHDGASPAQVLGVPNRRSWPG